MENLVERNIIEEVMSLERKAHGLWLRLNSEGYYMPLSRKQELQSLTIEQLTRRRDLLIGKIKSLKERLQKRGIC